MEMSSQDRENTILRYRERYQTHGYSPLTLGWTKGKQDIRSQILTSFFDLQGKTILDIGCGFGDLNLYLRNSGIECRYIGVDIVQELIDHALIVNQGTNSTFIQGDFLAIADHLSPIDIAIGSGIFNHRFETTDNYQFIESTLATAFHLAQEGIAFDFLSSKVDYPLPHTFHSEPERVLGYGYTLTRNVILRNDYMPFEFALCLYKDDSFSKEDTLFSRYKSKLMSSLKNTL